MKLFKQPANKIIYKIYKDTRYKSRYVVTFTRQEYHDRLIYKGIKINGIKIKGLDELPIRYYMPNFPSFVSMAEIKALIESSLEENQKLVHLRPKWNKEFNVPVGGWYIGITNGNFKNFFLDFEGESYEVIHLKDRHVGNNVATRHVESNVAKTKSTEPKTVPSARTIVPAPQTNDTTKTTDKTDDSNKPTKEKTDKRNTSKTTNDKRQNETTKANVNSNNDNIKAREPSRETLSSTSSERNLQSPSPEEKWETQKTRKKKKGIKR